MVALTAWSAAPVAALSLAVVEFITFFDNAVVALGNRLGVTDRTESLNRWRFLLHAVCISLLLPVYLGIGRLAGVGAFDSSSFVVAIVVAVVAIAALGYFGSYRNMRGLMPVNYYGCLRYAQSVSEQSRLANYDYSETELTQKAAPPIASIVTVCVGLGLSLWIGFAAGFWIPAMVTGLMLFAGAFPPKAWGAVATSCLEIVYSGGMVFSLVSLAGS